MIIDVNKKTDLVFGAERYCYERSHNGKREPLQETTFEGQPVDPDRLYRVGLQMFHFNNVDLGFGIEKAEIEKNGDPRVFTTSCRDVIDEYLSKHQHLNRETLDRLILL